MLVFSTRWTKRILCQLPHRASRSWPQVQWPPLHGNDLVRRMAMEKRGLHVEGGVDVVEGAQEGVESEVAAIRREIWDVRNGGV